MRVPRISPPRRFDGDIWQIGAWMPVPGFGVLPVNAYVIQARQPVLVDTGLAVLRTDFLAALERIIDPSDLHWIWITHMDPDHVGNLTAVLERAPRARVVTTYLGMGKMGLLGLPQERAYLLNPGQVLDAGGRRLRALTPPTYDAPETTAVFDESAQTLFSADAFGAVLPSCIEDEAEIGEETLKQGMRLWASVDAPWLANIAATQWQATLARMQSLMPARVLGSHLPPSYRFGHLLKTLVGAAGQAPFVGPDQAALEQAMQAMEASADADAASDPAAIEHGVT